MSEPPTLYVLDEDLGIALTSAGGAHSPSPQLREVLHDAVDRVRRGRPRVRIYEGRIVRGAPLIGAAGVRSYAVLLQRFSVDALAAAATNHFALDDLEARAVLRVLRGEEPDAAERSALERVAAKAGVHGGDALLERLIEAD